MRYLTAGFLIMLGVVACERMPSTTDNLADVSPAATGLEQEDLGPSIPPLEITPAPPAPSMDAGLFLDQAEELRRSGDLAGARDQLQQLANNGLSDDSLLAVLGDINLELLLTPAPAPEKIEYQVVPGDSLSKIAQTHHTTVALIKKSNHLSTDLIRVDQRLRIFTGSFSLTVSKKDNTLTLMNQGKFFKRYRVGTGEYSKTPVGQFKITSRISEPTWYRGDRDIPYGDQENILGTHWLGLDIPGYGIHGTWDDTLIGKQATAGCVRLRNADIEELYTILPLGTPVTIQE